MTSSRKDRRFGGESSAGRPRGGFAVLSALLVSLSLVMAIIAAPSRADASPDGTVVSLDGVTWGTSLSAGLFDGLGRLVPGDSATRTLWVRNTAPVDGLLRISLRETVSSSTALGSALRISAANAPADFRVTPGAVGGCTQLLPDQLLASGESVAVPITMEVMPLTGLDGQDATASITLLGVLSDPAAGALAPTACPSNGVTIGDGAGRGDLASTGASTVPALLIMASALLGAGLFLVMAIRRNKKRSNKRRRRPDAID